MNLSQTITIKYLTILSENFGRKYSEPLQKLIVEALQEFEPDQIERGFDQLLRDYNRTPNMAVILSFVRGAFQFDDSKLIPELKPTKEQRLYNSSYGSACVQFLKEGIQPVDDTERFNNLVKSIALERGVPEEFINQKLQAKVEDAR